MAFPINTEEAKAGQLPLPSPLDRPRGGKVGSATEWNNVRRPEILDDFTRLMYGALPPRPESIRFELRRELSGALGGIAKRREVRIHLANDGKTHFVDVLWYLPLHAEKPVPAIAGLNFPGNHAVSTEPDVYPTETARLTQPAERGAGASRWPFSELIRNGFSVITANRGDLFPDRADGRAESVWKLFRTPEELTPEQRDCTAISAWAFGCILLLELLESEPAIDRKRIWLHGHSRLGKTALWAAANDPRFAGVVSNDSGCCGAALSRRNFGEHISYITETFPWWFRKVLDSYAGREEELPFDQHFLISLVAPRPVLVASATEDLWADPRGEFLAAKAAGEVYRLFGAAGLGTEAEFPPPDRPLYGDGVGYYLRTGKHDVTLADWQFVLQFIEKSTNCSN